MLLVEPTATKPWLSPEKSEVCGGGVPVSEAWLISSLPSTAFHWNCVSCYFFNVTISLPSPAASQSGLHVFFIFCDLGVTRLADISLNDPISISIADEIQKTRKPASQTDRQASSSSNCMEQENFAVPKKLKQYFMMVPSKLRLVTLAAFILEKCKVRLYLHLYC